MKKCVRCGIEQPFECFNRYPKNKDGLYSYCKKCCAKRNSEQKHIGRVLVAKLKANPCTDCGNRFPPECMDFDHITGVKVRCVSKLVHFSNKAIAREIAKCELVCSNCHRIRTNNRRKQLLGL